MMAELKSFAEQHYYTNLERLISEVAVKA